MNVNGKEHIQPRAFAQPKQPRGNFVHRIFLHFLPAEQAVSASNPGKEQPQVIENLGSGSDGRPRIARGVLLLDGDGGRDPVDQIDIGLLNPLQKLPGIGRQRLHITPLPLGIDRIESKRRLARSGDSGHHRKSVVLNLKIDVLEVMNPGPAYHNAVCRHLPLALQTDQKTQPNLSIIKRA